MDIKILEKNISIPLRARHVWILGVVALIHEHDYKAFHLRRRTREFPSIGIIREMQLSCGHHSPVRFPLIVEIIGRCCLSVVGVVLARRVLLYTVFINVADARS